jgi:PKD repeat protein
MKYYLNVLIMKKLLPILVLLFPGILAFGQPTTNLQVTSSNSFVADKFDWGINKAFSYVKIGTPVAGYAAAMDTATFCARDVAHMAEGAHLLGLDAENWSMLHLFAYGANRRVTQDYYWPRWHYHFNGSDSADFGSCQWRCLPTTFDVMQSSYRQYLWTGNDDWINDTEFETYYSNTHDYTKFMQHQDVNSNGVADETMQLATYWEQSPDNFIEAGDAITYQYMALVDYSKILEAKGDLPGAATFAQKAADLKTHFETVWYSNEDNMYIRGFDAAGNSKTDWGRESTFLMPYSDISDQGPRTERYLDFITKNIYNFGINIEATTYLAEIFYLHGRTSTGWYFLKNLMASGSGYPEVSYLIINNTIQGLMGIRPDAPNDKFYTLPKLSSEVSWIQADHVPIGANDLTIKHEGTTKTTAINNSGVTMTWEAQFYGQYNTITVNGTAVTVGTKSEWGKTVSYITTPINVGETIVVEATNPVNTGIMYLSDMNWTSNTNESNTKKDFNTAGNLLFMAGAKSYEKGLGVVSNTEITYDISGLGYKSFITDVGIDDEVEDQGSVTFEIWVDGVKAFDSGTMLGSSATKSMAVNIEGANTLKLVVTDAGDGSSNDWADWGNAYLSIDLIPVLSLDYENLSGGDGNGIFDPGETMDVHLKVENTGSASTGALVSTCTAMGDNSSFVTVNNPTVNLNALTPGSFSNYTHSISIDPGATIGAQFQLRFIVTDGTTTIQSDKKFFITDMYLSDANYTYGRFDYGSLVKDKSITNSTITLNGVTYDKGLGVHANCEIKYDLGGSFLRFISDVGVQDGATSGTVTFEVWADGLKVFETGVLNDNSPTVSINLDVTGVNELELRVTDGGDGINSDHADWAGAKVSSTDGLIAGFTADNTIIQVGETVAFTDNSMGNPISWNWTFEGGSPATSTDQNPVVTYNTIGTYDVTLEVGNGTNTDVMQKTGYIEVTDVLPPTADFTADDTGIQPGETVGFTDLSINASSWLWTFEGGTPATSTVQNPVVTYNTAGTFDVTLEVSDGTNSDVMTKTDYIHVTDISGGLYLSDTTYTYVQIDWGTVQMDQSIDGNTITLNGVTYQKGLGVHANCELRYALDGNFSRFVSDVGVDDEVNGSAASVAFEVWADGDQLFSTSVMNSASATVSIDVDISGKNELVLIVTDGGDGINSDHADWAGAKVIPASTTLRLDVTAFLEGPYNDTTMNSSINSLLPLSQPFSAAPWNYPGTESVNAIPGTDIVDWILIDLRDTTSANLATPSTSIGMQAAFIRNDGRVVDLQGNPVLSFANASVKKGLFVVVFPRNHVPVISADAVTKSGNEYIYNFSTGENRALGGTNGHKDLGSGVWGMFAGNSNGDFNVDDSDKDVNWMNEAGLSGYLSSDTNMDGQSNNEDKNEFWLPNRGKGSYVPE